VAPTDHGKGVGLH